ncbi:MAG TPA: SH3 domain-containing protein [Burkholderiales bacterium]|jgi:SH3-like domain-containing protein|nr:SH3 domain-containing protein [Burkholderiales bacterium]
MKSASIATAFAVVAGVLAGAAALPALAAEYRAVAEPAIFYDAPAIRGKKLFVAPKGMPVEVVISIENWVKVRDRGGDLMWIERKALTDKRTVVVSVPAAQVRDKPDDGARVLLDAAQDVSLDLVEPAVAGWAKVHHRDGVVGYVRVSQVWGL